MNIYFICTGNTCRSPMAAAILDNLNIPNVNVRSAGIYAQDGSVMSPNAQQVLNENMIKHEHEATRFHKEGAEWADVILTMTCAHKEAVLQLIDDSAHKVYTLYEYIEETPQDVQDPYGGDVFTYEQTFKQLQEAIEKLAIKLKMGEES